MKKPHSEPLVTALVRAGRDLPLPPPQAFERTLAHSRLALGTAAALGVTLTTARAAAAASQSSGSAATAIAPAATAGQAASVLGAPAAGTSWVAVAKGAPLLAPLALVKPVGIGVLLGALGVGAVGVGQHWAGAEAPAHQASAPAPAAVDGHPQALFAADLRAERTSPAAEAVPTAVRGGALATQAARTSLLAEIRVLDGARTAFARGDGASARRWLAVYRTRFPQGQLAPEAELLEQRVLGDQTQGVRPSP